MQSDNGTEYVNSKMDKLMMESGIQRRLSIPSTPQQNGRAERLNRTLLDKARCMILDVELEKNFWAEAVATAAYIHNRTSKLSLENKTPQELWTGKKPNLSHLKIFGCKATVHIPEARRGKMDAKGTSCIFIGYCSTQKGYRLWDPSTQKVIVSRDVTFYEHCNSQANLQDKENKPKSTFSIIDSSDESEDEDGAIPPNNSDQVDMDIDKDIVPESPYQSPNNRENLSSPLFPIEPTEQHTPSDDQPEVDTLTQSIIIRRWTPSLETAPGNYVNLHQKPTSFQLGGCTRLR